MSLSWFLESVGLVLLGRGRSSGIIVEFLKSMRDEFEKRGLIDSFGDACGIFEWRLFRGFDLATHLLLF